MSMSAMAPGLATVRLDARSAARAVRVFADLAEAEPLWRRAERELIGSPYQRYDHCLAWFSTLGRAERLQPMIVAVEQDGAPVFILPLAVKRRAAFSVARLMGGSHSNFALPLFAPGAMDRAATVDVLDAAGRAHGVDLYALSHVPRQWDGADNPLALVPARPSANLAFRGTLGDCPEKTVRAMRGSDAVRKMNGKERKLAATGPIRRVRAETAEERAQLLAAFHAQKAAWFKERGLADVFSDPPARDYVARTVASGVFELHALFAGETIVATACGGVHNGRFSMAFNSYDPAFARMSPGDLLIRELVGHLVGRGVTVLDFGVGDLEYKRHWLDQDEAMVDVAFGVGGVGRAAAASLRLAWRGKAWVKSDARLARLAARLRPARPAA
jgi:CelD/BcsL family acetyltransferase involved in cellulose biosynthesis